MLQSTWSLKIDHSLRLVTPLRLPQPSLVFQGDSTQLRVYSRGISSSLPFSKQAVSVASLFDTKLYLLTNTELVCFDVLTNTAIFQRLYDHAHGFTLASHSIYLFCGYELIVLTLNGDCRFTISFASAVHTIAVSIDSSTEQSMFVVSLEDGSLLRCQENNTLFDFGKIGQIASVACLPKSVIVGFKDGIIALYESRKPKWKAKSQKPVWRVLSLPVNTQWMAAVVRCDGQLELRNWQAKGETLSRLRLNGVPLYCSPVDFREEGGAQILCVLASGEVRGVCINEEAKQGVLGQDTSQKEPEKAFLADEVNLRHEAVLQLQQQKAQLEFEVQKLQEMESQEQEGEQGDDGPLESKFSMQHSVDGVRLNFQVVGGLCSGVVFQGGIPPLLTRREMKVSLRLSQDMPSGESSGWILLHSSEKSQRTQLRILKLNLNKFWQWRKSKPTQIKSLDELKVNKVSFKMTERNPRVVKWINQSFGLNLSATEGQQLERLHPLNFEFRNSYTGKSLNIKFAEREGRFQFRSEQLQSLSALFEDFLDYTGVEQLDSELELGMEKDKLRDLLQVIQRLGTAKASIAGDMIEATEQIKALLVQGESARVARDFALFRSVHADVLSLNRNLAAEAEKKKKNTQMLAETLKGLGLLISQTASLRQGKARQAVVSRCREAIRKKQFAAILSIMKKGAGSAL